MTSRFEREFNKASTFQASLNILSRRGNREPTLCEVLELIKIENRKARRQLPPTVNPVDEEAAKFRSDYIRRVLNKPEGSNLERGEYEKGLAIYRQKMRSLRMGFRKIQKDSVL